MRLEGDQPSGYGRHEQGKWESNTCETGSCVTEVKAGWQSWNRDEPQFPCRSALWSSVAHTDWQGSISQVSEEESTTASRREYPHRPAETYIHTHNLCDFTNTPLQCRSTLTQKAIKFALQAWAKALHCGSLDKKWLLNKPSATRKQHLSVYNISLSFLKEFLQVTTSLQMTLSRDNYLQCFESWQI